ncbi:MAG TPA: cytochrome P450 [Nannocystaceae bacterium]|nr:cytochrome P450 [Nannocystaceae bacterium]
MSEPLNIMSPEFFTDPYPHFDRLRRETPVVQVDPMGIWAVTRYDDVNHVLRTPEVFSSAAFQVVFRMLSPAMTEGDTTLVDSMIGRDPPEHTRLRRLVSRAFTPEAIKVLEPRIRDLARRLLDSLRGRQEFDLVHDFSMPLPVIVIAEMLGVDPDRKEDFKRWSDDTVSLSSQPLHQDPDEIERRVKSRQEFHGYFREMIEARRLTPRNDLITALIKANEESDALTADEILGMTVLLLVAGNETTTNLIANAVRQLLQHPDIEARLRANPKLIPNFIEEVLRYDSPVLGLFRLAKEETVLGGQTIPEGAFVLPFFASANRDEKRFTNADRFDIDRDSRGHLAFGYGIHFCLGAPLARVEARIGIEELLTTLPSLQAVSGDVEWIDSFILHAPKRLLLRYSGD